MGKEVKGADDRRAFRKANALVKVRGEKGGGGREVVVVVDVGDTERERERRSSSTRRSGRRLPVPSNRGANIT
jgi:hypothetical protein